MAVCAFTAPVSGTYSTLPGNVIGKYRYVRSNKWYINEYISSSATGSYAKGDSAWLVAWASAACSTYAYDAEGYGVDIYVAPLESTIKPSNSITINQNVWNGNIYQDNSTNLTYIYPEYTTINENNETVTNISNNPIIYNNETKQYYTYDSVTNNYYYITYETPTPSPSPDPGTDPTPTPEPGEDTGDTSGIMKILQEIKAVLVSGFAGITEKLQNIGVGGSTPETAKPGSSSGNKGQSWWDKLLSKIGDAIIDGLLGAISVSLSCSPRFWAGSSGWSRRCCPCSRSCRPALGRCSSAAWLSASLSALSNLFGGDNMRNTLLLQLPGVRKICLYYIAAPVLLLCLFLGTACPAHAEEIADSSSSTSDSTDTDDDLTLGGDITDAYDKYAGGVDSGLDDVKDQYDGLVNDSALGFVQAVTSWIPTEFWVIVGLSIGSLVVLGIVSWLKG